MGCRKFLKLKEESVKEATVLMRLAGLNFIAGVLERLCFVVWLELDASSQVADEVQSCSFLF